MNYDKLLLSTLSQDAFYQVNKELVIKLGIVPALVLSYLIDKKKYFMSVGQLDDDGGFFLSAKKIREKEKKENINVLEYELGIGEVARRSSYRALEKKSLIRIAKKGHPARHYYYVNSENVFNLISSSPTQSHATSDTQSSLSSPTQSHATYNKNKEQEQINKSPNGEKLTSSKFIEYKNRLRAIDEKFGLSYLESSKANQYYEQAQIKFEQNNDKHFSEFFESILAKLEKLTSQKLDRFAFKQGFTIESLVKFDLQGCAKVEAWYNDCYPQSKISIKPEIKIAPAPVKFSESHLDTLKEFLA